MWYAKKIERSLLYCVRLLLKGYMFIKQVRLFIAIQLQRGGIINKEYTTYSTKYLVQSTTSSSPLFIMEHAT
ncbi:hypothetical protein HanIR_Chr13g0622241 [Helianthus annuus]|nr:hypothetical protein HanIR_Chr13g0622241 [Helianthus annuus]